MIFVSYYTKNTPYEKIMKTHLLPSLQKFNLAHDIKGIEDLGNWSANTSYKAKFLLKMLKKHKQSIVFIDADATIEKFPKLFFEIPPKYDIAVHYLDWNLQWRKKPGTKRELLSGTMLFRYNKKVLKLVETYIKECEKFPKIWEQKLLQRLVRHNLQLEIYELPAEYCCVILHSGAIPSYVKNPIIVHHQASRKYKK